VHSDSLDHLTHQRAFLGERHHENERRTWLVVALTFTMMVVEITGGTLFGDGWHMSTHAAALTISANPRFAFGTGKLGDLAGYTSAVVLGMIALLIAYESVQRLLHPVSIAYGEAIATAALGLAVNLTSSKKADDLNWMRYSL
jgi:Co/Zn/Cd efflux system component